MGSIARIKIVSTALAILFEHHPVLPVYGAVLNGENLWETNIQLPGFVLIGNEAAGISEELKPVITNPITIPRYGGAESLNAAVATAIICARFRTSAFR